jgi:hypothetical protein
LCCVALAFEESGMFGFAKHAGQVCPNLHQHFHCSIHEDLWQRGFAGCAMFDCWGAGQKVCQVTYGGRHWRSHPELAEQMFDVFSAMQQLHELAWYLVEALTLPGAHTAHDDLQRALDSTDTISQLGPVDLLEHDTETHRTNVDALLLRASTLARSAAGRPGANLHGASLAGADLRGADLRGTSMKETRLLGADLRGADLRGADVLGADLYGANLGGADLGSCLFLTQNQLLSAWGDGETRIPAALTRPTHWATQPTSPTDRNPRTPAANVR